MTTRRLSLRPFEDRVTPATFGIPWGDAEQVTVSFVPDGTAVNGAGSSLYQLFQYSGISAAVGEAEILRALQTWADQTPVNILRAIDQGQPLGVSGPSQGDGRFGDIRIAARPMDMNVLAITEPPGTTGDTRAGDIVLNTNMLFSTNGENGGYHLYSAMLQEAGHAFGIGNSDDPASPMYEQYSGVRSGLTEGDIANIQSLYGDPSSDPEDIPEHQGSNNLLSSALTLVTPEGHDSHSYYRVNGRLELPLLADWYRFQSTPVNGQAQSVGMVTVRRLEAGGHVPGLWLTNSEGQAIATELVTSTADTVTYQFFAPADQNVCLKVAANGLLDLGSLGAYQVEVSFRSVLIDFEQLGQGTLAANATTTKTLTLDQPALTKFSLGATGGGLLSQMSLRMVILNAQGQEVARLTVPAGQTQTLNVWLASGTYSVKLTAFKSGGLLSSSVGFDLKYMTLTDPVGAQPVDSTGTPMPFPGSNPPPSGTPHTTGPTRPGNGQTGNPPPPPPPTQPPPPSSNEPPPTEPPPTEPPPENPPLTEPPPPTEPPPENPPPEPPPSEPPPTEPPPTEPPPENPPPGP